MKLAHFYSSIAALIYNHLQFSMYCFKNIEIWCFMGLKTLRINCRFQHSIYLIGQNFRKSFWVTTYYLFFSIEDIYLYFTSFQ